MELQAPGEGRKGFPQHAGGDSVKEPPQPTQNFLPTFVCLLEPGLIQRAGHGCRLFSALLLHQLALLGPHGALLAGIGAKDCPTTIRDRPLQARNTKDVHNTQHGLGLQRNNASTVIM